jgi:hypothetical protein
VLPCDWSACAAPPTGFTAYDASARCVSFDSLTHPTKVWMVMPDRDVKTGFGVLADVETITIGSSARATVVGGRAMTCGLCFLGPIDAGNADFTVEGGGIAVNGSLASGPNATWTADSIGVSGGVTGGQYPSGQPENVDAFPDPWASATTVPPSTAGLTGKPNPCGAAGGSGIYGAKQLSPNQTCTLNPGLYVIVGAWEEKNNSAFVGAAGVTLYFTCGTTTNPHVCTSASDPAGSLDASNGELTIVAPTSGPRQGLAIVYDRLNDDALMLQGNGGTSVTGAVYAPASTLDFNGTSCFGFENGPVIALGVTKANGNTSCVQVTDSSNAALPPTSAEIALDR